MFKLGEYPDDEVKELRRHLDTAGIRSELKASLRAVTEDFFYKKGRLSELKGKGEVKDIERYQRYLEILRHALAGAEDADAVMEKFSSELDPDLQHKKSLLSEAFNEQIALAPEGKCHTEEDLTALINEVSDTYDAIEFAGDVLSHNDIEVGKDLENKLDDPILLIKVNTDDDECEEDADLARKTAVNFLKVSEIYVDEFSVALAGEASGEFAKYYPKEAFHLSILGSLVAHLIEDHPHEKVGLEDFKEMCLLDLETEEGSLNIDAREVAGDLARALEKNGMLKVKGDRIKWRKMNGPRSSQDSDHD